MPGHIEKYIPDLDRIAEHSKDPNPVILDREEYNEMLQENGLYRGEMSDYDILKAMELGLIKIWSPDGSFDVLRQIQSNNIDLRIGNEFWHYRQNKYSSITYGKHIPLLPEILGYTYKMDGEDFVFHPNNLALSMTRELVVLSNVVSANFDGRSGFARLGLSAHQTAEKIHSGFRGGIVVECSDANYMHIGITIPEVIGSLVCNFLGNPSTRPRNGDATKDWSDMQTSPWGFRLPEWDQEKAKILEAANKVQELQQYLKSR
jgi:deoxycytidine triphosphate deaminase